jgi:hypothetical protein
MVASGWSDGWTWRRNSWLFTDHGLPHSDCTYLDGGSLPDALAAQAWWRASAIMILTLLMAQITPV